MIEVQQIWIALFHQRGQVRGRIFKIFMAFLHPVQTKSRRAILQALQFIHPRRLLRLRNVSEANQRDSRAARDETGNKFARVRPYTAQRVGRDQYVHANSLSGGPFAERSLRF